MLLPLGRSHSSRSPELYAMSLSKIPLALACAAVFLALSPLGAAESAGETESLPPILNTTCLMDGKPIDVAKSPMVMLTVGEGADAKHFRMAMCSEACMNGFKKEPAEPMRLNFGRGNHGPNTQYR